MADAPPKATFGALEDSICSAIETLDRIDEFCLPSELPDNQGLGVNINDLVRKLGVIKDAGARVRDDVPGELVHEFIDEGRTPDEFSAQLHGRVTGLRDGVHAKADLLRRLEEQCLATCGDLADPEAVQPATADAAADGPPNR